jgi:hypothetical protein
MNVVHFLALPVTPECMNSLAFQRDYLSSFFKLNSKNMLTQTTD